MSKVRKLLMAGGTFSTALAIGFIMQNGDALAARFNAPEVEPVVVSEAQPVLVAAGPSLIAPSTTALDPQLGVMFTDSAPSDIAAPVLIAAVGPDAAFGAADADKTLGNSCEVFASASVEPHAMVSLDVYAPCAVSQRFTLHHNGMMFTQSTDAEGEARLMIPALAAVSVFIVAFDSGATAVTSAAVPDAGLYQRAVLQFEGAGGLDLHVQENGAGFGASGHKWAGQPGDPSDLDIGAGYLIELGDNSSIKPRLAQVYTYPVNDRTADTTVSFSVEAAITPANCGQDLAAQSLQSDEFGGLDAVDLVMTMPGCEAVGDLLILGNMFADIQVAAAY